MSTEFMVVYNIFKIVWVINSGIAILFLIYLCYCYIKGNDTFIKSGLTEIMFPGIYQSDKLYKEYFTLCFSLFIPVLNALVSVLVLLYIVGYTIKRIRIIREINLNKKDIK